MIGERCQQVGRGWTGQYANGKAGAGRPGHHQVGRGIADHGDFGRPQAAGSAKRGDHPGIGRANIRPRHLSFVEGVLYRLMDHLEIDKMDRFEGTPWQYRRELVTVETQRGVCWAWTYVGNPAVIVDGLRPDQAYLDHLVAGGEFLSAPYLERLVRWPTSALSQQVRSASHFSTNS